MRLLVAASLAVLALAPAAPAATVTFAQGTLFTDDGADGGLGGCSRYAQCGTLRLVTVTAGRSPEGAEISALLADPGRALGELTLRNAAGPLGVDPEAADVCRASAPGEVRCGLRTSGGQGGSTATRIVVRLGAIAGSADVGRGLPARLEGGPGDDTLRTLGEVATLIGGSGDDVLTGGASADTLSGGSGADLLDGGRGDDLLRGGGQTDRLIGGAGGDRIGARDRTRDVVSCGSGGGDRVTSRDRADEIRRGCERVARPG